MPHRRSNQSTQNGLLASGSINEVASTSRGSEVVSRATRRRFSTSYKLRILAQADRCKTGEIRSLLRGEGLYSSHLSTWRTQRERGELGSKKRGRPAGDPREKEVVRLTRENERLKAQLDKAETIIEVQKNFPVFLD